jgi:hypothetical protein
MRTADGRPGRRGSAFGSAGSRVRPPSAATVVTVAFFVYLSMTIGGATADDSSAPVVKIDPHRLTVEVDTTDITVSCQLDPNDDHVMYVWEYSVNDSLAVTLNATSSGSRIWFNETTGELSVNVAQTDDTGEYTCIIIGVINGGLLIIFVACLIRSAVADRKRLRKYGQKM